MGERRRFGAFWGKSSVLNYHIKISALTSISQVFLLNYILVVVKHSFFGS